MACNGIISGPLFSGALFPQPPFPWPLFSSQNFTPLVSRNTVKCPPTANIFIVTPFLRRSICQRLECLQYGLPMLPCLLILAHFRSRPPIRLSSSVVVSKVSWSYSFLLGKAGGASLVSSVRRNVKLVLLLFII